MALLDPTKRPAPMAPPRLSMASWAGFIAWVRTPCSAGFAAVVVLVRVTGVSVSGSAKGTLAPEDTTSRPAAIMASTGSRVTRREAAHGRKISAPTDQSGCAPRRGAFSLISSKGMTSRETSWLPLRSRHREDQAAASPVLTHRFVCPVVRCGGQLHLEGVATCRRAVLLRAEPLDVEAALGPRGAVQLYGPEQGFGSAGVDESVRPWSAEDARQIDEADLVLWVQRDPVVDSAVEGVEEGHRSAAAAAVV
jgi:hypothetical protein